MSSVWHGLQFRRDHRWTPPHMSAYLDSDLSVSGRARLERHTGECLGCRQIFEDLQRLLALLQVAPPPEPLADGPVIARAVMQRLHE